MAAPDPSRLDANQVLQGSFDEATGRLRTDSLATVVNADIDVALDATEDNVAIATPGGNFLDIETDGSINVNSVDGALETTQQQVLSELQTIDTSLDAIELDVDAIRIATQSIDADIDVALSTRASEVTLSALNAKVANNYGVATGAIRTASQVGNASGIANFGAGTTGAQTLRTTSNVTRNGTELSYNNGVADANTLRTSAQIANSTGAADFNSGATTAQTLRTASNLYNSNGLALSDLNTVPTRIGKTSQLDPLGRIRTTALQATFEDVFTYDDRRLWSSLATGGATILHSSAQRVYNLATTTASGDRLQFRTRIYHKSNPANSKILYITANFNDATTNNVKKLGMFDVDNGLFFQLSGSTLSVVIRTSSSGAPVDTVIPQSTWNVDKLDGTGASGVTLNPLLMQVYVIDYSHIGADRIRFGVMINGDITYVHQILLSNSISFAAPVAATLPIAFDNLNTGIVVGTPTLKVFSTSLQNESGPPYESNLRTVSNGTTLKAIIAATKIPILSMRSVDTRIPLKIENFSVFLGTTDELYITVTYGGTLTGASFSTTGFTQMDTAATAITGGRDVYSFYIKGGGGAISEKTVDEFFRIVNTTIGSDLSGTTDILTICGTSLTGAANAAAVINLRELI